MADNPVVLRVRAAPLSEESRDTVNWNLVLSHLRKFAKYDMVECEESEVYLYFFNKNYSELLLARDDTIYENMKLEIKCHEKRSAADDYEIIRNPSSDSVDSLGIRPNKEANPQSHRLDETLDAENDNLLEGLKQVEQSLFPTSDRCMNNDLQENFYDAEPESEDYKQASQAEVSKNAESFPGLEDLTLDGGFSPSKDSPEKGDVREEDKGEVRVTAFDEGKAENFSSKNENSGAEIVSPKDSINDKDNIKQKVNGVEPPSLICYWEEGTVDPFFNRIYFIVFFLMWTAAYNGYFYFWNKQTEKFES